MFEHASLDGERCRVVNAAQAFLKPEVLELREPKNSLTAAQSCRTQYAVVEDVLDERYLPPETQGDSWNHDGSAAPWWMVVGHPPHGGVVADFNKYIGGSYKRELKPDNNIVAFAESGEAIVYDGSEYALTRGSDSTEIRGKKISELRQRYYA